MSGKVIGINGRKPPPPPDYWHLQQCDYCESFHFKWSCKDSDMLSWRLVCSGCETEFHFDVKEVTGDEE